MLALAVALVVLYELAVQVTGIHDKRALKRDRANALPDDQATPLEPTSNQLDLDTEPGTVTTRIRP
jgi:sec-independent protein translocase protein TatC